jgi:uncharacterized protein (TIGR03905 family)
MYKYKTKGTCSSEIMFDIQDGKLRNVRFINGCSGSLQGICKLVEGMEITKALDLLKGIKCGHKKTSCPDQLSIAINKVLEEEKSGD